MTSDDPLVPVHLLIFSVQTAITTLTCVVDYMSWNVATKGKMDLGSLYLPYLILCGLFHPCNASGMGRTVQRGLLTDRSGANGFGYVWQAESKTDAAMKGSDGVS